MRRRRVNRGTWLPIDPSFYGSDERGFTWFDTTLILNPPFSASDTIIRSFPLTRDLTPEVDQANSSSFTIQDYIQGNDYVCKRIVGKVWASLIEVGADPAPVTDALLCFAIAVLPVRDSDQGQPDLEAESYNPFFADNSQAPWLFRRTWRVSDATSAEGFPRTNAAYGDRDSGMHIDTRGSSRRIRKEQRLFGIFAAAVLNFSATAELSAEFGFGCDLRLYGEARRGKNKSTFK